MSGTVDQEEFSALCALLRIRFRRVPTALSVAQRKGWHRLEKFVENQYLDYCIDALLVASQVT